MKQTYVKFIFFAFLITVFVSFKTHAQTSMDLSAGGSIIVGADTDTCNASKEGAIRYNSTSDCAEYCDGSAWTCPSSGGGGSCDTTAVTFTSVGLNAYAVPQNCTSLTIEAYGAGGGYDEGGGGGGSVVLDGSTLLVTGGGGGGGGNNDGGGGGGYGTSTITVASLTNDALTVIVGEGGECVDGAGGELGSSPYVNSGASGVIDTSDYIYGGTGAFRKTGNGDGTVGSSTYGGGGGAHHTGAGNITAGGSTYGGGGGATHGGAGSPSGGTSTNGNNGTANGGGGGGEFPVGQPNGTDGNNGTGGSAANGGPGNGAGSGCTTKANDGQVVITPVP